jgi:MFS family permease
MWKFLTRTILLLSLVSLFTDIASEMLYPIMPLFLRSIAFTAVLIGILEGLAEAVSGLSKGYFGKLSDAKKIRMPFVRLGYSMSAISKPMMALFAYPWWIFIARSMDRLGKGIRTGARDALLSDESSPENKGKVFGFHRALDTLGAVLGPAIALVFLNFYPEQYKTLFLIAFIPGVISIGLTFLIKEKKTETVKKKINYSFFSFLKYWKESPGDYRKLVRGLLTFNSSDLFLLLMLKQMGLSDTAVISTYILYNLVYALSSFPMGSLGDKIGLRKTFIIGLVLFVITYGGMAVTNEKYIFYLLFIIYGIYAAATEGISKAWISNIVSRDTTATAIGTYTAFNSIFTMLASLIAGLVWNQVNPKAVFIMSAAGCFLVIIYFIFFFKKSIPQTA